ncbi:MAG: phosphoribosylformylglycinamidine synthase, partial [Burkholderiaceae bacterium]|nr:phosphoribosylformylglycinamidine synthase [Burkholderiaceae bacterium]
MPAFLTIPGQSALSEFRRQRLLERLCAIDPRVAQLDARHFYVVWSDAEISIDQQSRLVALLGAEQAHQFAFDGRAMHVVPRIGTISPWASKATDIAHNCAMSAIHRIERGTEYRIAARAGLFASRLDDATRIRLGAALHDRMTETALVEPPDPRALFAP